jgi:hypothetical protein
VTMKLTTPPGPTLRPAGADAAQGTVVELAAFSSLLVGLLRPGVAAC